MTIQSIKPVNARIVHLKDAGDHWIGTSIVTPGEKARITGTGTIAETKMPKLRIRSSRESSERPIASHSEGESQA